jgi:glycosyltransferase involved in cell wall biosynthesis
MVVKGKKLSVFYVVGRYSPMSIPLDVVRLINEFEIDLTTVVFRKHDGRSLKRAGHKVIELEAKSSYDIRSIKNLLTHIRRNDPDVVHIHHTSSSLWASLIAKFCAASAVVRTEHGSQRNYSFLQGVVHGVAHFMSDIVLCNSENTYRNLYPAQKWLVGNDWQVVYNGVDVNRIDDAVNRGCSVQTERLSSRTVIGSVGRLIDAKNYQRLIQAFPSVLEKVPDAHFLLIGDGPNRSELEQEARMQDVDDRITFMGELSRDEVYATLHEFDLFVMPSVSEGFCVAAVEAMMVRCPIVCSDISTFREVVGSVATYVNPRRPESIAQGIVDGVQEEPEMKEKRARVGRQRAERRYSIEQTARAYARAYFQVTDRNVPETLKVNEGALKERIPNESFPND